MIISILQSKKSKNVCLTPESVSVLVQNQHTVLIEGAARSPNLKAYLNIGAYIINTKEELLDRGGLIVKKSWPDIEEINYLDGEGKIFFTKVSFKNRALIDKMLEHKISLIDYSNLRNVKSKEADLSIQVEFSNYILPFLLELANKGIKALVDDEVLRHALILMHGKIYNNRLALLYNLPCYEF